MTHAILLVQWAMFIFLFVQVGYLLFFSLAATFSKRKSFREAVVFRRIRIFIPGYKEDAVILETARKALLHNYPKECFEVVVIADSFSEKTMSALNQLPLKVVEVKFEKSTKGKALQKAIEATAAKPVDIVLVLDADNEMAQGFLHKINDAFESGCEVVQGHRTAKELSTSFAFLDACTEEINNHIFRRGHVAMGLPSALIGSGMAFSAKLFTGLLHNIGDTAGEDKEIEFRLMRQSKHIAFLDGAFVYDEKVAQTQVFSKQRSRWFAMQMEFFKKYFSEGWKQLFNGNIAFFDKVFQTYLLPRVMLVALIAVWWLISLLFLGSTLLPTLLASALAIALFSGIPSRWYNKKLFAAFLQIPGAMLSMMKAMMQVSKAAKTFVHTPHGMQKAK